MIVIVGRGNLQAQWCSLSMDLAVAYKVPLIFIGTNKHISMEDQCEDVGISCIQKVSNHLPSVQVGGYLPMSDKCTTYD